MEDFIKFEYIFSVNNEDDIPDERLRVTLSEVRDGAVDDFLSCCDTIGAHIVAIRRFTGFLDRDGVEIWEGDIIECNGRNEGKDKPEIGTVVWEKKRAGFMVNVGRPTVQGFKGLKMAGANWKKVIGDIYK